MSVLLFRNFRVAWNECATSAVRQAKFAVRSIPALLRYAEISHQRQSLMRQLLAEWLEFYDSVGLQDEETGYACFENLLQRTHVLAHCLTKWEPDLGQPGEAN